MEEASHFNLHSFIILLGLLFHLLFLQLNDPHNTFWGYTLNFLFNLLKDLLQIEIGFFDLLCD